MKFKRWMGGLALAIPITIALGHIWATDESIHFKATDLDFGRPPLRYDLSGTGATDVGGYSTWRPGTQYAQPPERWWEPSDPYIDFDPNYLYRKTNALEDTGKFRAALDKWIWAKSKDIGDSTVYDSRIDLLRTILKAKDRRGAKALLAATRELNPAKEFPVVTKLSPDLQPWMLIEHCKASKQTDSEKGAVFAFIASRYPKSPTVSVALNLAVGSYLSQPAEDVSATDIRLSEPILRELERVNPNAKTHFDVMGWRGRIQFVQKHYEQALRIYRRQQNLARTQSEAQTVVNSILLCCKCLGNRPASAAALLEGYDNETTGIGRATYYRLIQHQITSFTGRDSRQFWIRLRSTPRLLSAYLDFRQEMDTPTQDLLRLASRDLGTALRSSYGPHILLRISEVAYNLDKLSTSKEKAIAAQKGASIADDKALATYLLASISKKQGDWAGAEKGYQSIITTFPTNYLVGACRENLALVYERKHQFGKALDQYWALDYPYDVAYLIDIRMTPKELEGYIAEHPNSKRMNLLRYSLGIRFLRTEQFKAAAQQLSKLSSKSRENLTRLMWEHEQERSDDPVERTQDPLITAQQLGALSNHFYAAKTMNAKAEAKWKIACYYYNHRNLLLYNAALWMRDRSVAIGFQWNSHVATKEDNKILYQHHWEHECYAKTLKICKQIVKEYPRSRIRFQAAYRAACAAERLSNMNQYWRWVDETEDLLGQSVNLMAYARRSPNPGLAKAAKKFASLYAAQHEQQLVDFRDSEKERVKEGRPEEASRWTWY